MNTNHHRESKAESPISRRDFLNTSILVTGGAIVSLGAVGCAAKGGATPEPVAAPTGPVYRLILAEAPELGQVGGVKQVKTEGYDFFVIRESNSKYIALNNICTHEACPMQYRKTTSQIVCPCHQSVFDLSGTPLKGPAQKPLVRFPVTVEKDALVIALAM